MLRRDPSPRFAPFPAICEHAAPEPAHSGQGMVVVFIVIRRFRLAVMRRRLEAFAT